MKIVHLDNEVIEGLKKVCKKKEVTMRGTIKWLIENVEKLEVDWEEIRGESPSANVRWAQVMQTVREVKEESKSQKEIYWKCGNRGLTKKQTEAALKKLINAPAADP